MTLAQLRQYAIARSLFTPTTLPRALERLGFVQADPIRAPARAQDLTLRHRVTGYLAGDLERRYPRLDIEEDFFINYGFVSQRTHALMHPRVARTVWTTSQLTRATDVLAFVREHGVVHPRDVDAHFAHGKVTNWFGGSSNATTQLLDGMHYRGLLRVARRDGGTRLYAPRDATPAPPDADAAMDALVDVAIRKYAPLPERSLRDLTSRLYHAVPQWRAARRAAFIRAQARCANDTIDGETWYWPANESPRSAKYRVSESVRLLAPFDPLVWDRRRFELFWGWAYRFEAYTPAPQRVRGYYALPLLWRDEVIGWANVTAHEGSLAVDVGYVAGRAPRDAAYRRALAEEVGRLEAFVQKRHGTR